MSLQTMYAGVVNSPATTITNDINSTDTTIYLLDPTNVPAELPNLMVLGTGANAETVKVLSIDGSSIEVERGFQGTARSWNSGTVIARNFTEYDYNALKENIEELKDNTDANVNDIINLSETVGDTTINDTLVPNSDTGLSVKILLSWLGNMIKSITGKSSWRIKPTKNLEELNTELGAHKADVVSQRLSVSRDISLLGSQQITTLNKPIKAMQITAFINNKPTRCFAQYSISEGFVTQYIDATTNGVGLATGIVFSENSRADRTLGALAVNAGSITITWSVLSGNALTGTAHIELLIHYHGGV